MNYLSCILTLLVSLLLSCQQEGGSREESPSLSQLNQIQGQQQNSSDGNGIPQNPNNAAGSNQQSISPFQNGSRSTMKQCQDQGKVWIAVNDAAGNVPTCGGSHVSWGCCIEEVLQRFPRIANQISNYHGGVVGGGFTMYSCENAGNGTVRIHYVKKGSTRTAIEHKYMNFTETEVQPQSPKNCPKLPTLTDDLLAQIRRFQTPESFKGSNDPMQSGGDEDGDGDFENPDGNDNIVYPKYNMDAKGLMRHRKGAVNVVAKIEIKTEKRDFYINQTGTRAISGDYEDRVNKHIGGNNGRRVGMRASQSKLLDIEKNNYSFILTNFLVYADSMKNQHGKEVFFEPAVPAIVSPGRRQNYDVFYGFPELKYTTQVTGEINKTMTTVITREVNEPNRVVIKVVHDIGDNSGTLWQKFPLPHISKYTIDPVRKIITQMESITFYHDPEGGGSKRYQTNTTSKTCKITTGTDEKTYNCR